MATVTFVIHGPALFSFSLTRGGVLCGKRKQMRLLPSWKNIILDLIIVQNAQCLLMGTARLFGQDDLSDVYKQKTKTKIL